MDNPWTKIVAGAMALVIIALAPQAGIAANEDIVINEVFYKGSVLTDWVELKNVGSLTINVSSWILCARFSYNFAGIGALPLLDGNDFILEPGEIIRVQAPFDLNNTSSDLGIYTAATFASTTAMVDFVQWGTSVDVGRSDVAFAKGIWDQPGLNVYDFVATAGAGESVAYSGANSGGGLLTLSSDFTNGPPTPGAENNPPTGIGDTPTLASFDLAPNFPNPFNPSTRIRFSMPVSGLVTLTIYDARGALVKTLVNQTLPAGEHVAVWNGTNDLGRAVASGIYFSRLEAGGRALSRKMVLLK